LRDGRVVSDEACAGPGAARPAMPTELVAMLPA
jgi:hypothetical protein